MKGSRNRKMWRHNHTGTPHLLPSLHRTISSLYDAVWHCPLKSASLPTGGLELHPLHSVLDSALVICCSLFVIHLPTPFFWNAFFSDYCQFPVLKYSSLSDPKSWETPGLEFASFSLNIHSPWRGPRLWMSPHTTDGQVCIPALTALQNPNTGETLPDNSLWICTPNWKWPKLNFWFQNLSSHSLTHLRSHPWFLSPPTPDPSANLSALLSTDLGSTHFPPLNGPHPAPPPPLSSIGPSQQPPPWSPSSPSVPKVCPLHTGEGTLETSESGHIPAPAILPVLPLRILPWLHLI